MEPQTISIIRSDDGQTAIWQISLNPALLGSRSGAWVYPSEDPRIATVTTGTVIVEDVQVQVAAITDELTQQLTVCRSAFNQYLMAKSKLEEPRWPNLRVPTYRNPDVDQLTNETLTSANQLGAVLEACHDYDDERARLIELLNKRIDKLEESSKESGVTERRRTTLAAKRAAAKRFIAELTSAEVSLPW